MEVTLPRGVLRVATAGGALLLLLLIAILTTQGFQVSTLNAVNDNIQTTDRDVRGLSSDLQPTLAEAPSFLRRGRPFVTSAKGDIASIADILPSIDRSVETLTTEAVPALREIRGAGLGPNLAAVPRIETRLGGIDTDLTVVRDRIALLAPLLESVNRIDDQLAALPRLETSLGAAGTDLRDLRRQLGEVRADLQEVRERIVSIDRKTGGRFPPERAPDERDGGAR